MGRNKGNGSDSDDDWMSKEKDWEGNHGGEWS